MEATAAHDRSTVWIDLPSCSLWNLMCCLWLCVCDKMSLGRKEQTGRLFAWCQLQIRAGWEAGHGDGIAVRPANGRRGAPRG